MTSKIRRQRWPHALFYLLFGGTSIVLMVYYLSNTLIHFTTPQQFPINSFVRFPLSALIFPAEVFSVAFGVYFVYTLLRDYERPAPPARLEHKEDIPVAVLLPVYREPVEILDRTLRHVNRIRWPGGVTPYLCMEPSPGPEYTAKVNALAAKHHARIHWRANNEGKKAGNINNAIKHFVKEPFFVILDADQAPEPELLERTMDWFSDEDVSFVQTPQFFVHETTPLERAAKVGTNIFFQAMCMARSNDRALVFCGTNAVIRTKAFHAVNGFSYYTSTEDIELGMKMDQHGYHGVFVPEVLVKGFAPPDFSAYATQQYRWSNGNLAILRESWFRLLGGRFSLRQQLHNFFALAWWLIGLVTLVYIAVPLLALFAGLGTHHTWLPTPLIIVLYVWVVMGISMIYVSLKGRVKEDPVRWSDALLQYSLITNSAFIYSRAAIAALFKRYAKFKTTNKAGSKAGYRFIIPNLLLGAVCFGGALYAGYNSAIASTFEQLRTFLPIAIWLLFYAIVLFSSILFVGTQGLSPEQIAREEMNG